jgi:hypothetical protein
MECAVAFNTPFNSASGTIFLKSSSAKCGDRLAFNIALEFLPIFGSQAFPHQFRIAQIWHEKVACRLASLARRLAVKLPGLLPRTKRVSHRHLCCHPCTTLPATRPKSWIVRTRFSPQSIIRLGFRSSLISWPVSKSRRLSNQRSTCWGICHHQKPMVPMLSAITNWRAPAKIPERLNRHVVAEDEVDKQFFLICACRQLDPIR